MSRQRLGVGLVVERSTGEEIYKLGSSSYSLSCSATSMQCGNDISWPKKGFLKEGALMVRCRFLPALKGSYPKLSVVGAGVGFWVFDGIHQ